MQLSKSGTENLYSMRFPLGLMGFLKILLQSGIKNRLHGATTVNKEHWIECVNDKYTKKQIADVKSVLNIITLYAPLPIFWALQEQLVS